MTDRRQLWETLRERAEQDDSMLQLLESLSKIEKPLDLTDEFDAANLKLPYSTIADEPHHNGVWK